MNREDISIKTLSLIFLITVTIAPAGQGQAKDAALSLPDFSYTQGWLGADDAYSVPLGRNTSLWLFGDTFVGDRETKLRTEYKAMPRNSVGISVCKAGGPCSMKYFWKGQYTPKPRSFFDTGTDDLWYWPMDAYITGKTLYVSLLTVRNKPGAKTEDAFGFEIAGTKLATVDNAFASPDKWQVKVQDLTDSHLWVGNSIVADGKYLLWYTQVSVAEGKGYMTVLRTPIDNSSHPTWEYMRKDGRWTSGLPNDDAMHVIDQPISEMSVRYHPSIKKWLALSTGPEFPSTYVAARTADSAIGPWSAPQKIYEFPEMKRDSPGYDKDTFCYAVKEHIEFAESRIALTYACNSFVYKKTVDNMNIYRPRPVMLDLPK